MFRRSHRTHRFRRCTSLVLLALLMVGLGLPRLLLVCNEVCCAGRVALDRSCGTQEHANALEAGPTTDGECLCCKKARATRQQPRSGGGAAVTTPGCSGCAHHALGCDLGLPAAFETPDLPPMGPCHLATLALRHGTALVATVSHPPATGPPRPDLRTERLAATILRI